LLEAGASSPDKGLAQNKNFKNEQGMGMAQTGEA